jgi:pimeloyl-ACP methyl ester carboxylesterase
MEQFNSYDLPVGYHQFHKKQVYNFQFNRWYSLGFARYEDMVHAGATIKNFTDWKPALLDLAKKAEQENRLKNACIYYRGAEFYIDQNDPDKNHCYQTFLDMFYDVFKEDNIKRFKVPYQNSYLPALLVRSHADEKKGTILMHGGFDSFIEEFYYMMKIFSDHGYDVAAFEGPGQGGARRLYDLAWDEHWEKPTKAVLDHLNLDDVAIYGISMGGHLCLRAAAFEPRIKQVISSGGAVDYWKITNPVAIGLLRFFMRFEDFTTKQMKKKMEKDPHHRWLAENSMYITKIDNPFKASMKMLDMNMDNAQPDRITQDVLFLSGEKDHFIPKKIHRINMNALQNARSVKGILYTPKTHAQNHCQIGNIPLVCKDVLNWLDEMI